MSIAIHSDLDVWAFVTVQKLFITNPENLKALFSPNSGCMQPEVVLYANVHVPEMSGCPELTRHLAAVQ